jgi:transposase
MDLRQLRGLEIARQKQVRETKDGWLVKSQSGAGFYRVDENFDCTCPDSQLHKKSCKHAFAVRFYLKTGAEKPMNAVVEKRPTYPQVWSAYTPAQNSEIQLFDELLKDLVQEIEEPKQVMGRPRLSLKEQVFCSVQKVYSQLSSRRAHSLYKNAESKSQIARAPNYNAVNKVLNLPELTPILHHLIMVSASPLKSVESSFAIDSSGFRTRCFGQYSEQKFGLQRDHKWIKAHACVGVKTNVVTAIEVTKEDSADCPQFPVLIQKTAEGGFKIQEVSADKAYNSRENYNVVGSIGGQAYIPFMSHTRGKAKGSLLWKKAFHYFQLHADEFYEHYHLRSNVESTFAAIKKKFGDTLKNKNYIAQVNELLCKIIAHNIVVVIHETRELGINPTFEKALKEENSKKVGGCV